MACVNQQLQALEIATPWPRSQKRRAIGKLSGKLLRRIIIGKSAELALKQRL
jgi:hypothetical protein